MFITSYRLYIIIESISLVIIIRVFIKKYLSRLLASIYNFNLCVATLLPVASPKKRNQEKCKPANWPAGPAGKRKLVGLIIIIRIFIRA